MLGVTYEVSLVTFHVLHVVCYLSLTTKAMDPPSANSHNMHGRPVYGDPKLIFFPAGLFYTVQSSQNNVTYYFLFL